MQHCLMNFLQLKIYAFKRDKKTVLLLHQMTAHNMTNSIVIVINLSTIFSRAAAAKPTIIKY